MPYSKAIAAFVVPFVLGLVAALFEDTDEGSTLSFWEVFAALVIGLITAGIVYAVGNKDPKGTHQDQSVMPPPGGRLAVSGDVNIPRSSL